MAQNSEVKKEAKNQSTNKFIPQGFTRMSDFQNKPNVIDLTNDPTERLKPLERELIPLSEFNNKRKKPLVEEIDQMPQRPKKHITELKKPNQRQYENQLQDQFAMQEPQRMDETNVRNFHDKLLNDVRKKHKRTINRPTQAVKSKKTVYKQKVGQQDKTPYFQRQAQSRSQTQTVHRNQQVFKKKPPPQGYVCHKCNEPGHYIIDCPRNSFRPQGQKYSDHCPFQTPRGQKINNNSYPNNYNDPFRNFHYRDNSMRREDDPSYQRALHDSFSNNMLDPLSYRQNINTHAQGIDLTSQNPQIFANQPIQIQLNKPFTQSFKPQQPESMECKVDRIDLTGDDEAETYLQTHKTNNSKPFACLEDSSEPSKIGEPEDTIPFDLKHIYWPSHKPPNLTQDYDVIGFDMDHCLVQYDVRKLSRKLFELALDDLHENFNYPAVVKSESFVTIKQSKFIYLNCVVWDIDNGTVLKLAEGCLITRAVLGYEVLNKEKIVEMYGFPPIYKNLKWPQTNKLLLRDFAHGNTWTFMGYFEASYVPVVCHVVHLIREGVIKKNYVEFAFDLTEVIAKFQLQKEEFDNRGRYVDELGRNFPFIYKNPGAYIKETPNVKETLVKL